MLRPDDLASMGEIATLAGVTKQAVTKWRERFGDFPQPIVYLAVGPIWNMKEVEKWLRKTGRLG